jgi:hypothetical protein
MPPMYTLYRTYLEALDGPGPRTSSGAASRAGSGSSGGGGGGGGSREGVVDLLQPEGR